MYHTNLTQYLDATTASYPQRVAIIDGDYHLSFTCLRNRALGIASAIFDRIGMQKKQIIGVYIPKSKDSIIADIAVTYSGNTYMNLDCKHPVQRIHNIITSTQPIMLITTKHLDIQFISDFKDIQVLYIEDVVMDDTAIAPEREQAIIEWRNACLDSDLLCLINTSGSTGTPKGVALNHRGFIDLVENEVTAQLLDDTLEVVASLSPLVFDHHSFEICLMMMRAATLVLIPESFAAFPVRMLELMKKHNVTYLFWVPTIMVNIANMDLLSQISLPDLKKVWFAGEVFPTAKFNYWKQHLPEATFVNLYGPTEISVDCTYYIVNRPLKDDEPIPIGKAFPNTEVLLLDEEDKLARPGEEGEICVRGHCLAMGYYNNPEKTSQAFVQNPLNKSYSELLYRTGDIGILDQDCNIIFKGRRDTLIKHMGYRIELTEIENVIVGTLGLIKNCCVLYDAAEKRIVLYYEAETILPEKELRNKIGKILPRYMIPTVYKYFPELPRNNNGKIDRLLLKSILREKQEKNCR